MGRAIVLGIGSVALAGIAIDVFTSDKAKELWQYLTQYCDPLAVLNVFANTTQIEQALHREFGEFVDGIPCGWQAQSILSNVPSCFSAHVESQNENRTHGIGLDACAACSPLIDDFVDLEDDNCTSATSINLDPFIAAAKAADFTCTVTEVAKLIDVRVHAVQSLAKAENATATTNGIIELLDLFNLDSEKVVELKPAIEVATKVFHGIQTATQFVEGGIHSLVDPLFGDLLKRWGWISIRATLRLHLIYQNMGFWTILYLQKVYGNKNDACLTWRRPPPLHHRLHHLPSTSTRSSKRLQRV